MQHWARCSHRRRDSGRTAHSTTVSSVHCGRTPPWKIIVARMQPGTTSLMKDADLPSLNVRDTWSAVQSVLHSATLPNNNSQQQPRDPQPTQSPSPYSHH